MIWIFRKIFNRYKINIFVSNYTFRYLFM
jgi:hypothetical protein